MNVFYIITITTLVFIELMKFTSADNLVRFILPSSGTCTTTERAKIDDIFYPTIRRTLRHSDEKHRSLIVDCKKSCAGVIKYCAHPGCAGFTGRELSNGERELQTCTDMVNGYHTKLDTLRGQVSSSCSNFIGTKAARNATCLNDVIFGEITGAKVWEVPTSGSPVVKKTFTATGTTTATGYSFCKSMNFNIEALGDACIDDMDIDLTGPNGFYKDRYELTRPYFLNGDYNGVPFGETLSNTGTYKLSIKPYNNGAYMVEKIKYFTFTVNNC